MNSPSLCSHHLSSVSSSSSSKLNSCKTPISFGPSFHGNPNHLSLFKKDLRSSPIVFCSSTKDSSDSAPAGDNVPSSFCIIEGPETVQDFVQMQLLEIQDNIKSRRNKIFLLMEEVRRLRVQQRLKSSKVFDENGNEENEMPEIPSTIPFLSHVLELKLGIGGTSYEDFIRNMHLPMQLRLFPNYSCLSSQCSQVDPIVASFSGGAVGVIAALMILEANNVEQQEKKRCKYCHGTGYLACARCSASGMCLNVEPISVSNASDQPLRAPTTQRCSSCSGVGKVMCPTCLCTGMVMASEHDPRIDPFD
ncbi:hypothetical protein RHSIM_Rhsim03G0072900 [Rhododendron simsii]|uniref:Uncharacterized protein n=1 Tax=Rhododendron simsii TaxID=118357 RepID=A0A834H7L4_RHOSS|nr:hypothetical protein RHSIM_Rhsim03G0072900 [Rhododendron simsii]